VLVGQQTVSGAGEHELRLPLEARVAGVLRVTVFDAALTPITERLVHREAKDHLRIEVDARESRLLPAGHQTLRVRTTDETGRPVPALLGIAVSDRSVRDFVDEPRIGLASQASFFADVEALEDLGDFAPANANARRNIDLVLGTQGWRRFAWSKPDDVQGLPDDRGRRLLAREGRAQIPLVHEEVGDSRRTLAAAHARLREAREMAAAWWAIQGAVFVLGLVFVGALWCFRRAELIPRVLLAAIAPVGLLVISLCVLNRDRKAEMAQVAFDAPWARERAAMLPVVAFADGVDVVDRPPQAEEELPQRGWAKLQALGYLAADVEDEVFLGERRLAQAGMGIPEAPDLAGPRGEFKGPRDAVPPFSGGRVGFEQLRRGGIARIYAHQNQRTDPRDDFVETVYWNPRLLTDVSGRAEVEFDVSDRVTTWMVAIDGHGG